MARRPPRTEPQLPTPAPSAEKPGFEPMLPRARDAAGTLAAIRGRLAEEGCTEEERRLFAATLSETIADPDRAVWMASVETLAGMAATTPQARDTLVLALADEERAVRELAARHLGRTAAGGDGTAAVSAVAELLRHREPTVRRAAAVALGRTGSAAAVGPLRVALTDAYPPTRTAAADSLARLAPDSAPAVEDLIRLLLEDCHDPVAQAAVRALGRLVPHSAKAAVPLAKRLTANLSDYPLVQILKRMGPSAAETVPVLIALLETDPRALVPVSEILAAIGPAAEAAVPVLAKFRPSTYVIDALAAIGTPAAMAVLAEWAVQIRSGKVRVAEEALSALATFGPAAAAMSPLLLEALGLPAVPGDKAALIRALGCIGPADRSAPVLTRLFRNDPHDEVRHAAGFALWKLGVREPDPLAEMLTLLRKPKGAVQGAAVSAVLLKIAGLAPAERAAEILPLLATWSEDWNDHRATNAILAVSAFGKAAAPLLPVLVERLRKYRVIARPSGYAFAYSAMTTLKVVNDLTPPATAVERLVPFLAVREPDAFGAVAAMLVAHGAAAEPAIPALEAAARLKQRDIREIAADALADIRRAVRAARSGPGRD